MITTSLTLGPFTIPLKLILFVAAAAAAHLLLFIVKRKDRENFKKGSDLFFNSVLLFFLGWRLSIIFTNWSTFQGAPTALLYLPGSSLNHMAGGVLILLSILILFKRKKYSIQDLISWSILSAGSLILYFILIFLFLMMPMNSRLTADSRLPADSVQKGSSSESEQMIPDSKAVLSSEIRLLTIEGEEATLDLTGSPVTIVNFWASWCPPCRAEIPELDRFYSDYKTRDVRLITVNMTSTEISMERAIEFIENENVDFPVLLDFKGEAAAYFKINSVPSTFVFNAQGELISRKTGAVDYAWLKNVSKR